MLANYRTVVLVAWFGLFGTARAADGPNQRVITVSGTAAVKVVPDQVVLSLGVESFAPSITDAKHQNDEHLKKLLGVLQEFKIDPKQIQTGHLGVEPRYEYRDGTWHYDKTVGYEVSKSVALTLNDLSKFEDLLSAVLAAGANRIHGMEFRTTELRRHRDAARTDALKAAREKAADMARVLDQKVGRPLTIVEQSDSGWDYFANRQSNTLNANVSVPSESAPGNTFAPGQITINASVSVTFELE
jgi:hypothetical protein